MEPKEDVITQLLGNKVKFSEDQTIDSNCSLLVCLVLTVTLKQAELFFSVKAAHTLAEAIT